MIATAVFLLATVPQIEVDERNASDWPGHQGEVSIAVDPSAPERVVAASMDLEDGRLLLMASADSGLTWHRTQIPVSPGAAYHADPMVDFDSRGRVFLAHIPVATGNHPVGIEVARSLDGGRTWAPSVRLSSHFDRDDKVALEVDDHESSPYRDAVYVAWKWPPGGVWFARSRRRRYFRGAEGDRLRPGHGPRHGRRRKRKALPRALRPWGRVDTGLSFG